VAVSCEYLSPARFGDHLEIRVRVLRKGTRSLTYGLEITRGDAMLAKGKMTCVCCVLNDPSGIKAIPIPDEIAALIEVAPHQRED